MKNKNNVLIHPTLKAFRESTWRAIQKNKNKTLDGDKNIVKIELGF